jgi:cytoplasmic filament protein A
MYGHLQGHVQRGVNDLETLTNSLLRQKTDVGAFVRGQNAYAIVKCAFKDNLAKPKTVTDVKLSINILDTELISPIFHYQSTVEYIIKDLLSNHYMQEIDKEIEKLKDERIDKGLEELDGNSLVFEKMNRVENYTDDEVDNPKSKRYSTMSKAIMERINNLRAEIDPETFDQLNVRENLKKVVDLENIRGRGFNTAINSLTSILDTSKMGYQYIENMKNARELIIREYDDTDVANLPDERFSILLRYINGAQLIEERKAYEVMVRSFETEIEHIWDVVHSIYEKSKFGTRITDFDDLAGKYKNYIRKKIKEKDGLPAYEDIAKVWDEISFVKVGETEVEKMNRTYIYEKDKLRKKLIIMRNKLQQMYDYKYPIERRVMESRLNKLESEFTTFDYMINPYHVQPGVLLDIDITSIKRKKATLDGMANLLNEFLAGISKGFEDAAFASFSRRRSTVRTDLAKSFSSDDSGTGDPKAGEAAGRASFSEVLSAAPVIEAQAAETTKRLPAATAPAKRGPRATKADAAPKRRGRAKSSAGLSKI